MPVNTSAYMPLATKTLTATTTSVTFSSISQIYRDLIIVVTGAWAVNNVGGSLAYRYNGDAVNTNYIHVGVAGNGSIFESTIITSNVIPGGTYTFGYGTPPPSWSIITNIMDYSATDKHKSYLHRIDAPSSLVAAATMRWSNSAAINSISISSVGGANPPAFAIGSTFTLYGIAA